MTMLSSISSTPRLRSLAKAGGMLNRILLVVRRNGESFAEVTEDVEGKAAFALPLSLLLCFEDLSLSDRCFLP